MARERWPDRWLVAVALLLAVSVAATGALAVALTLQRRGQAEGGPSVDDEGDRPAYVAFVSDREGLPAVYIADVGREGKIDESNTRRVSPDGWSAVFPAWSPAGGKVAYLAWPPGEESTGAAVAVSTADGSDRVFVAGPITDVVGLPPAWSPDGTRLAFVSRTGAPTATMQVVLADGGGLQQSQHLGPYGVTEIRWSPSGDEFLLVAAPVGGESGLYRLSLQGDEMVPVLARASAADWSPDGKAIAVADDATHTVYRIRSDGAIEEVASIQQLVVESMAWSPDGRHIALLASRRAATEYGQALFVLDLESGEMGALEPGDSIDGDHWLVQPTWSPDGHRLLLTMGPMRRRPGNLPYADLWVYELTTGEFNQLTFGEGFEGLGVWGW